MFARKILPVLLLLFAIAAQAQKNFTYTPENPKPGDVITFFYEPAGDIANTILPVEGSLYQIGTRGRKADDLVMEKKAGKYTGSFTTDTSMNFIYLAFSADKKLDNNFNEGYTILLYENNQPRKGAYFNKASFFQFLGPQYAGIEANNNKALAAMEKEFEFYPDNRKLYLYTYVRLQTLLKKEDAAKIVQKEIESLLKAGLKEEVDYSNLEVLYQLAKLPEQGKFISNVKKEKFPDGNWTVNDGLTKFSQEKDIEKKKQLLAELIQKAETGGEKWKSVKDNIQSYKLQMVSAYISKKDWTGLKKIVEDGGITDKAQLAALYNNAAWEMQKNNDNMTLAEEFSRIATNTSKKMWKDPSSKKSDNFTQKQWQKNKEYTYAMYADTYGMVMYRMENYKKGLAIAKESALTLNKGKDADMNNTYALLAEKVLPQKQYVKQLEQFVKDGKSTSDMKDILKRAYVKDKKSEIGFDNYITALQKESYMKMLEELRKSMLNETASSFALVDLDGKKIQLSDLKGKVVVMDFWATWCGPCKASFPGMQRMVTKYKDDPNVKFVFIDTWERGDNKQKDAADFIANNKYTFHVLQDNEDKVVAEYKVDGIPTKFVIDKNGMIRFKAVGFDGSDDKLVQELTAMIEMAANEDGKKAF